MVELEKKFDGKKVEVLVIGTKAMQNERSLKVRYDGKVIAERILNGEKGRITSLALKLLRNQEKALESAFEFRNFDELTLLPTKLKDMERVGAELKMVRKAIKELEAIA